MNQPPMQTLPQPQSVQTLPQPQSVQTLPQRTSVSRMGSTSRLGMRQPSKPFYKETWFKVILALSVAAVITVIIILISGDDESDTDLLNAAAAAAESGSNNNNNNDDNNNNNNDNNEEKTPCEIEADKLTALSDINRGKLCPVGVDDDKFVKCYKTMKEQNSKLSDDWIINHCTQCQPLERSTTVYTGCGYTYSTKADRDKQCGGGSTSKWINDSTNTCQLVRGATVYTGCSHTYSAKADRDKQCGGGSTSKWIDDRYQ